MPHPMRRAKQQIPPAECEDILTRRTSGVLALAAPEEDFPYAVPLSYAYASGHIYFHSAPTGHKLDLIAQNPRGSFCVIDRDQVVPDEYTTYFRSVIAFGPLRILEGGEKRAALELLAAKYTPDDEAGRTAEIEQLFDRTCMIELAVEHMTGKEAIELTRQRR